MQLSKKFPAQLKGIAQLLLDIGKIVAGTIIVGFFIPSAGVNLGIFIFGIIIACGTFYAGISFLRFVDE